MADITIHNPLENYNTLSLLLAIIRFVNSQQYEDLQKAQWDRGEDREGVILGVYSIATEKITKGRKKAGEPYNLLDTGDFREGTYLIVELEGKDLEFTIGSTDDKENLLKNKIGNRIFGLQENKEYAILIRELEKIFIQELEKL